MLCNFSYDPNYNMFPLDPCVNTHLLLLQCFEMKPLLV
jgi:hypothetical protein